MRHEASVEGNDEKILRAVIKQGADVEAITVQQTRSASFSRIENHGEVIHVLADAGASIGSTGYVDSCTHFHRDSDALSREALYVLLDHMRPSAPTTISSKYNSSRNTTSCGGFVGFLLKAGAKTLADKIRPT